MKCVMIIDETLPPGQAANTAAALGISLSARQKDLTGPDVVDGSGRVHPGITNIPVPILVSGKEHLKYIYDDLIESRDTDLIVIGFNDIAKKSQNYKEFAQKLSEARSDRVMILGLCLYGDKKSINKLTGNLKLMK